jgi:hypothetical protein
LVAWLLLLDKGSKSDQFRVEALVICFQSCDFFLESCHLGLELLLQSVVASLELVGFNSHHWGSNLSQLGFEVGNFSFESGDLSDLGLDHVIICVGRFVYFLNLIGVFVFKISNFQLKSLDLGDKLFGLSDLLSILDIFALLVNLKLFFDVLDLQTLVSKLFLQITVGGKQILQLLAQGTFLLL